MVLQRFFDEEEESDDASESGEDQQVQDEVMKDGSEDESEDDDGDDDDDEDDDEEDAVNHGEAVEATEKETVDPANKPKSSMSRRSRKKLEKFAADKTKRRTMETERRKR